MKYISYTKLGIYKHLMMISFIKQFLFVQYNNQWINTT